MSHGVMRLVYYLDWFPSKFFVPLRDDILASGEWPKGKKKFRR